MKTTVILLWALLVFSCSQGQQSAHEPPAKENAPAEAVSQPAPGKSASMAPAQAQPFDKEFTAGPVTFKVAGDDKGKGRVHIFADTNNKHSFSMEFDVAGHIADAFLLDLNGDGFSEVYLVVGNGPNHSIQAFSSYRDRSAGEIVVRDDLPTDAASSNITVKDGQLIRVITDEKGNRREQAYALEKGETSFLLSPVKK